MRSIKRCKDYKNPISIDKLMSRKPFSDFIIVILRVVILRYLTSLNLTSGFWYLTSLNLTSGFVRHQLYQYLSDFYDPYAIL